MANQIVKTLVKSRGFQTFGEYIYSKKTRVAITSAQLKTLHSAPLSIVAAPPAGFALIFDWATLQFIYPASGGVQYTGGGVIMPVYHGQTTDLTVTGGVAAATIQAAASIDLFLRAAPAAGGETILSATGIDLYAATANFAAGNGTAAFNISYLYAQLG